MKNAVLLAALLLLPTPAYAGPGSEDRPGRAEVGRSDSSSLVEVTARVETPGVFDDDAGGNGDADDPAIWVDRRHPERSRVIGTVKNAGLQVYDLSGNLVQSVPAPTAPSADDEPGRFNNVDIVRDFRLGGRTVDLAVTSDRGRDQIRNYVIDSRDGRLTDVTADTVPFAFSEDQAEVNEQMTVYGLDVFRDERGRSYVVATRRHTTEIGLFRLVASRGRVTYRPVDTLVFPDTFRLAGGATWSPCEEPGEGPQLEGLVVDEASHVLYAAQEDIGLWRLQVSGDGFLGPLRSVERTREYGVPAAYDEESEECVATGADPGFGGRIAADVEGLTIYPTSRREGTLLVSSQGDNTFYTYDRRTNRPLGHFALVDGPMSDGSQDCDGADTVAVPLPGYPHGLLVVQDGDNTPGEVGPDGEVRPATDFKLLDAGVLRKP